MIKKVKILILVGVLATVAIVLLVAISRKPRGSEIMSQQEAEQRVQLLKEKITVPIDEVTREKINTLTNDLAHAHKFVEINGESQSIRSIANRQLREEIGERAVPQLIDAAANHSSRGVRQTALDIIYDLHQDDDSKLMEYLPVFVRSMEDVDSKVRGTAVAQIGKMARRFHFYKRQKELEQLIPYLVKALSDKDKGVEIIAGAFLFRIGRRDLVPQELIKKEKFGEWS